MSKQKTKPIRLKPVRVVQTVKNRVEEPIFVPSAVGADTETLLVQVTF